MSEEKDLRADRRVGLFVAALLLKLTREQLHECLNHALQESSSCEPDSYSLTVAQTLLASTELWGLVKELSEKLVAEAKEEGARSTRYYSERYKKIAPFEKEATAVAEVARSLHKVLTEALPTLAAFEKKERW